MSFALRDLTGGRAVVTGASSGIGAATAEALAALGMRVALLARRRAELDALAERIGTRGAGTATAHAVDVTDHAALAAFFAEEDRVDVLVCSAGTGTWGPVAEADPRDWRRMIDVNLYGALATAHAALPALTRAAAGDRGVADAVMISSFAGRKVPGPNSNVYAATKHGLNAFSEALRQEVAPRHVRVGLIEPGVVTTPMTTSGAPGAPDARGRAPHGALTPQAVAEAALYMATRPPEAAINEILLRPTEQAN